MAERMIVIAISIILGSRLAHCDGRDLWHLFKEMFVATALVALPAAAARWGRWSG